MANEDGGAEVELTTGDRAIPLRVLAFAGCRRCRLCASRNGGTITASTLVGCRSAVLDRHLGRPRTPSNTQSGLSVRVQCRPGQDPVRRYGLDGRMVPRSNRQIDQEDVTAEPR